MRLSLQAQYAICGVFDLAYNGHGEPIQVRVIGERQGIPARYLEQIFQRLRRGGLVRSKRGPGGGYTLAREPEAITLRQIVEAVEGPLDKILLSPTMTAEGGGESRPAFLWPQLTARLGAVLEGTTVERLCRDAARAAVPRADPDAHMYFI